MKGHLQQNYQHFLLALFIWFTVQPEVMEQLHSGSILLLLRISDLKDNSLLQIYADQEYIGSNKHLVQTKHEVVEKTIKLMITYCCAGSSAKLTKGMLQLKPVASGLSHLISQV